MVNGISNLFLSNILNKDTAQGKSGVVEFTLPTYVVTTKDTVIVNKTETLRGWLSESPSYKLGNTWQPMLPSMDALGKASQAMTSSKEVVAWLGGAQSAWVGASPLEISLSFYLFSIDNTSKIKKELLKLLKLSVISAGQDTTDPKVIVTTGMVHGGYKPQLIDDRIGGSLNNTIKEDATEGFISIKIGNQLTLRRMLLVDVTPEHSSLEVPDHNPLYIKVNASFKSYRPITVSELTGMFNISK
jgi:hypothetical protein